MCGLGLGLGLEASGLGLGLGLEPPGLGLGLGLQPPGLGLGLGLQPPGLGLGLGLGPPGLDYKSVTNLKIFKMTSRGAVSGRGRGEGRGGGRRVQFSENDEILERAYSEVGKGEGERGASKESRMKTGKHTLDSDEEDEEQDDTKLAEDDIEGEEEGDVDIEEGVRFTPFNMREEMEEGHFDTEGMYIFKSKKGEIHDSWMDDIDWVKIKQEEKKSSKQPVAMETIADSDEEEMDEVSLYKEMLGLMLPGETVLKAIKRLGGGGKKGAGGAGKKQKQTQQWKKRKAEKDDDIETNPSIKRQHVDGDSQSESTTESEDKESTNQEQDKKDPEQERKKSLDRLVEMASQILSQGNMEIYEYTFEKLNFKLNSGGKMGLPVPGNSGEPEIAAKDSGLDMFADDIAGPTSSEASKSNTSENGKATTSKPSESASTSNSASVAASDEVRWEYKWEDNDLAAIHGPFSSAEMLDWTEQNYFKDGVFVRKITGNATSGEGSFYSSRRIDFDLYI